jgi:hypothetical protein
LVLRVVINLKPITCLLPISPWWNNSQYSPPRTSIVIKKAKAKMPWAFSECCSQV